MNPLIDMNGESFGDWTVINRDTSPGRKHPYWIVRCKCGKTKSVRGTSLRRGESTGCGCRSKMYRNIKHGHSPRGNASGTYISWRGMLARCGLIGNTSKIPYYKYYGAIGVTVCERWLDFKSFLHDMGQRPEGMSLDRIDPFGNYEPSNCRWTDGLTQRRNRRKIKTVR